MFSSSVQDRFTKELGTKYHFRPGISPKKQQQPTKQKVFNMHGKIFGLPSFESFMQQGNYPQRSGLYLLHLGAFDAFVEKQLASNKNLKDECMFQWCQEICGNKTLSKENNKLYDQTLSICENEGCHNVESVKRCFDALLAFKKAVDNQKVKLPVISDKISNDKKLSDKKKNDKKISPNTKIDNKISPNKKYKLKLNKNKSTLNMAPIKHEQEEVDSTEKNVHKVKHGSYFNVNEEDIQQEEQQGGKKSRSVPQKNRNVFDVKQGEPGVWFIGSNDVDHQMRQTGAIFVPSNQLSIEKYDRRNVNPNSHHKFNRLFKKETFGSFVQNEEDGSCLYLFNGMSQPQRYGETLFRPRNYHSWPKNNKLNTSNKKVKSKWPLLNVYKGFTNNL